MSDYKNQLYFVLANSIVDEHHVPNKHAGFTLVELIAVIIIMAALSGAAISRIMPTDLNDIQAAKDIVISSLFSAQQKSLAQTKSVRVITSASGLDIRLDANNDGNFSSGESIHYGGTSYPVNIPNNVTLSTNTINFDRLGRTTATTLTLTKGGRSVTLNITGMGYAYQ